MSQSLHLCRICGKKFETLKGVYGHQRMHSSKINRIEDDNGLGRIWGFKKSRVCSVSSSCAKETEAFDIFGIGSTFPMTEIEKQEVREAALSLVMLSQRVYDFASIRNLPLGGDDVMDLEIKPCPLRSKLQKKTHSVYKCGKCDKSFGCYQSLGGHQRLHRSIEGKLAHKREYTEDDDSLSDSSEAKKIVTQPSSFEVFQEEMNLQCVEPQLEFHELLAHSGFDKSSTCSMTRSSSLPSPPEARKIVSHPSSFGVSQEKILHCVESKQDFSELLYHSGFDKSTSCSKTRFSALHSPLRSKPHSSYRFKICGKSFVCSQALASRWSPNTSLIDERAVNE